MFNASSLQDIQKNFLLHRWSTKAEDSLQLPDVPDTASVPGFLADPARPQGLLRHARPAGHWTRMASWDCAWHVPINGQQAKAKSSLRQLTGSFWSAVLMSLLMKSWGPCLRDVSDLASQKFRGRTVEIWKNTNADCWGAWVQGIAAYSLLIVPLLPVCPAACADSRVLVGSLAIAAICWIYWTSFQGGKGRQKERWRTREREGREEVFPNELWSLKTWRTNASSGGW